MKFDLENLTKTLSGVGHQLFGDGQLCPSPKIMKFLHKIEDSIFDA